MIHILTFFVYCLVWMSLKHLTSNDEQSFFKGVYLLAGFIFLVVTPVAYLYQLFDFLEFDIVYSAIVLTLVGFAIIVAVVKSTNKKME